MNTIRFTIKAKAIDSYIYAGQLFLFMQDGRIMRCSYEKVINRLKENYPDLKPLITLAFLQNSYMHSEAAKIILGVKEVMNALHQVWDYAASTIDFVIDYKDIEQECYMIGFVSNSPVLDVKMYNKHIFFGNKTGLYEIMFDEIFGMNNPAMHKRFDSKVVHVDAKFETVVISAGHEGLFTGYVPENEVSDITEKEIVKKSFRSAWSIYNIMNYEQPNEFTCLVNGVERIPIGERKRKRFESQESYKILEVGKEQLSMDQLMRSVIERGKDKMNNYSYTFNSHQYGYFLKKNGKLLRMNMRSKQEDDFYYSSVIQEYQIEKSVKGEKPISASILPNGCVLEYFDKVVLCQDGKTSVIENEPTITVRSFVNSYRYKNIVAVTKEEGCTFHSVDTIDMIPSMPIYKPKRALPVNELFENPLPAVDANDDGELPF